MHEECGIFGIFGSDGLEASSVVYYGLFALQHRGQDSCGIAANHEGVVRVFKDRGLVADVFSEVQLAMLPGKAAIGHVRYTISGESVRENAQPLLMRYSKGQLAIAHNGNLVNSDRLRDELEQQGAVFQTTIDSEVIAYLVAHHRTQAETVEEAVVQVMNRLRGAYSLLILSRGKMIAARDPLGIRPLCLGRLGDAWLFASESCALDAVGADFVRDVEPGEVIRVDRHGLQSLRDHCRGTSHSCIFEYIYFARPDSQIDGISVYASRVRAGQMLARQHPVEADLVFSVPESGTDAAIGYAAESGIPYGKGLNKNGYVGRTFIKPTQQQRETSVRIKLNPIRSAISGKRVVMVDDSIVRGTTTAHLVAELKSAGAREVHVRISSPAFRWPCYYGVNVPSLDQLIIRRHSPEEICRLLGADSLGFLSEDSLEEMVGEPQRQFCKACLCGVYPIS